MPSLVSVYATLFVIMVLLVWVGRRFAVRKTRGVENTLKDRFVRWMRKAVSEQTTDSTVRHSVEGKSNRSDVERTLAALDDLYEEFRDETQALRRDFATALDSLRHDIEHRISGIEAQQSTLQATASMIDTAPSVTSVKEAPVVRELNPAVTADGLFSGDFVEGIRTERETPLNLTVLQNQIRKTQNIVDDDTLANLNDAHFEALKRMQSGAAAASVARDLGIGLGEVAILERMFLTSPRT